MTELLTAERPGWAAPPKVLYGEPTREEFEAKAANYLIRLREGRQLSSESQTHMDRMFTWAIGLMGAGIFLSPNFFQSLAISCPQGLLLWVLTPWVIGIIVALAGRLYTSKWQSAENLFAVTKAAAVERLLLSQGDPLRLSQELLDIINNKSQRYELGHRMTKLQRYGRLTTKLYYTAHVALGAGIITVIGFVSLGRFCG